MLFKYFSIALCAVFSVHASVHDSEIVSNILDSRQTPIKVIQADILFVGATPTPQAVKPVLKFYYESLCPDCKKFYPNFVQVVRSLDQYLEVHIYPYGNAETINYENGTTVVNCQHGTPECYGNKLHACALDIIENSTKAIRYNGCMMSLQSTDSAADQCGKAFRLEDTEVTNIKQCAKSDKGNRLLVAYGEESKKAGFNYVPFVTINGKEWNGDDLMHDVCLVFVEPPEPCITDY